MSEDAVKKASVNKNIKKLRAVSMVCGLTRGWQQWVSENEEKQSSEPSGWAPSYPGEPKDTKKDTGKSKVSSKTHSDPSQDDPETRIRTGHVVKTVSRDVQERSAGIDFLTKRICKDSSVDELDRMLSGKGSPTRRRKCSNMVSELRRSWKELEQADGETEGPEERDDTGTVKRSSLMGSNKDVDEANKINALSQKYSAVGNLKSRWQNWASEHTINQKLNPFSEDFDYEYSMSTRLRKGEEGYGRPKEGSKTAERAKRAEKHIHREIDDMCFVIRTMAEADPDGRTRVTFGELFDRYVRISDKVVGILMRARKHGKVAFEGEMLWQGQDDEVIITLLI